MSFSPYHRDEFVEANISEKRVCVAVTVFHEEPVTMLHPLTQYIDRRVIQQIMLSNNNRLKNKILEDII